MHAGRAFVAGIAGALVMALVMMWFRAIVGSVYRSEQVPICG